MLRGLLTTGSALMAMPSPPCCRPLNCAGDRTLATLHFRLLRTTDLRKTARHAQN